MPDPALPADAIDLGAVRLLARMARRTCHRVANGRTLPCAAELETQCERCEADTFLAVSRQDCPDEYDRQYVPGGDRKLSDDAREAIAADQPCRVCGGEGVLVDPDDDEQWRDTCPSCGGHGTADILAATLPDGRTIADVLDASGEAEAETARLRAERDVALRLLRLIAASPVALCIGSPAAPFSVKLADADPEAAALLDALAAEAQP